MLRARHSEVKAHIVFFQQGQGLAVPAHAHELVSSHHLAAFCRSQLYAALR
jgi:hypothetical protein